MKVENLPFNKLVGILESNNRPSSIFCIEERAELLNHLDTFHASAIYSLAEASSGEIIKRELEGEFNDLFAVLRKSEIKYSKPGNGLLYSYEDVGIENKEELKERINNKGRAIIKVSIEIKDEEDNLISKADFEWFVKKRLTSATVYWFSVNWTNPLYG